MSYEKLELSTATPVLSWANHALSADETKMAKNVASLPFVFKHVALMPDVHLGKGALVGSVIATKEAVIPAAVGVDIGCFVGETLIPVVDGKSYLIQQLAEAGKEFYIYSCTTTGRIVAACAIARLTRRNASLVKVVLDNGEEIKCTPDHLFMLRDGTYEEACHLRSGISLMPFYSECDRDGNTLIQQNDSGKWQKAHLRSPFGRAMQSKKNLPWQSLAFEEDRVAIYNHKVVGVVAVAERENVYCLSVPEYNNFALKAGVFVHNCGMAAVKMPFKADRLEGKLKKIRLEIEAAIPVGFNANKEVETAVTNWQGWSDFKELHSGVQRFDDKALKQMGSLGGGNHFIELCIDTEEQVWLMLHSGSRGIGNQLAQCHISTAKDLAKLADLSLPDLDLAYFVAGTPEFAAYWRDLQWAQNYARYNRDIMMARFKHIVEKHLAGGKSAKPLLSVNCHHNYAEKEIHFGEEVYVTRKGAVRAREEDYGIIPGSMGAKSYIVKGKGHHDSYCSCFVGETKILTEFGLMSIADVYNCPTNIKLVSYNQKLQKFELKNIIDKSVRNAKVHQYSLSQTRRRLNNTVTCTADHPFATYDRGVLTYRSVEQIALSASAVIVPTQIDIPSNLSIEEQDINFYYLLGVILSDGTIHFQERKNAPKIDNRLRGGKYLQTYIRVYQSVAIAKQPFMEHLEKLFKSYTSKVSVRNQKPRTVNFQGRLIQGEGLVEITVSDFDFVEKVQNNLPNLANNLLSNPYLALYFLAGYLDGDGTHNQGILSISVGKKAMFSSLVNTLLSLGVAYKVYPNRNNYVVEFRDNSLLNKLRLICKRLIIDEPPHILHSDKLLLASTVAGGQLICKDLNSYAKSGKMIAISKFEGQAIDLSLVMNRLKATEFSSEMPVYNFTVEDNPNYVVFTEYYTPILVHNCSHGAGRLMSRNKAKNQFTIDDLIEQTKGIECRKDDAVLDEIPAAYKPIDEVMKNQSDLVEVVATLKQVVCVKG